MAIDTGNTKTLSPGKSETFVGAQLTRAERRIRLLDLTTAFLGLLGGTLAYAVLMVLVDSQWQLSSGLRQLFLLVFALAVACYVGWTMVRPLTWRINPYFAARKMEETLPEAKNSVINWLDLHDQKLAPAIRGAINNRAARDLARADIDKAISGRRAAIAGGIAGLMAGIILILFIHYKARVFGSFLGRAFAPFDGSNKAATRTFLEIISPQDGNATIPSGRALTIAVQVNGRIPEPGKPDAVKLHWRYGPQESYQVRPLQPGESAREWSTILSVSDVRDGFWYKVTGGDHETEEFQVTVRTTPAITAFQATYHFRPYLGRVDEVRRGDRKIEALRGTEVSLLVHTNRPLKSSELLLAIRTDKKSVAGQPVAGDPQSFQVGFVVDETGMYSLSFVSTDDEQYSDPVLNSVIALPDRPPEVELTKPGQDIRLPANGVLMVEGKASDDIGVQALTLQMKTIGAGPPLRGKTYRADQGGLKLPSGGYPLAVDYKDVVDFSQVFTTEGKPYTFQPGMELEYWLEARDACDWMQPNVSQSKHFRLQIDPPAEPKQQQQDRDKAQQEKKEHDAKEDQQRKKEDQDRSEQKKKQEQEKQDQQARDKGQPDGQDKGQDKPQDNPKGNEGSQSDSGTGKPGENSNGKDGQQDQATRDQAQKIKDELNKQQKEQTGQKGNNQGQDDKGQSKPAPGNKGSKDGKGQDQKDGQKGDGMPGQQKDGGQAGSQGGNPSEGKDSGKPDGKPEPKADGKPGDAKGGQSQAAKGKAGGQKGQNGEGQKDAGQNKDMATGAQASDSKDAGKDIAKDGDKGTANKAAAKTGDKGAGAGNSGAGKPSPDKKGDTTGLTQGAGKNDPNQHSPTDADRKDLERLAKQLQSGDRDNREQAANQLDKVKEQAKDPEIKDLARRMSDALRNNPDNQAAQAKPGQSNQDPMQPPGDADKKPGQSKAADKGDSPGEAGQPKPGDRGKASESPGSAKGGQEGDKSDKPMDNNSPSDADGKGDSDSKAKGKARGAPQAGQTPNFGGTNASARKENDPTLKTPETPVRDDKPQAQRATEAQLEDFKKKLNKKVLERLKMTEEARRQFLKNYADLVKRDQARADKPEVPLRPQQGATLPSTASQRPADSGTGLTNDTVTTDRGKPPPAYRDDYAEFNRLLAKPQKK